jgi:uncharacterized protein involved in exopolysaccharide biosynthesis
MKNTEIEQKLADLESRNVQLETNLSLLAARNSQLETGAFSSEDEIDLKELWNAIWSGKWLIIGITFVFSVASVLYALSLPDEYKSTALLAPASSSSSSQLGKLAGQFGGLASLAGINLGGGGAEDKTVIAMEIMKTWGFLEKFIKDNNIEVEVFAAEGWDRATDTLRIDPDLYDIEKKKWVREFKPSRGQKLEPNGWELYEEFRERVTISQDKASGLISLSVEYYSPLVAKTWTELLVRNINTHIQKQDRAEALKSIEYLNTKIKETSLADMQSVFYQLIEEQTKTLMLAEVSEEYVFKTISPAKVAEEKSNPKRALIAIFGFLLGGIFSVILSLLLYFNKKKSI